MKITTIGTDYIKINENNIRDKEVLSIPKIHLIKLDFIKPTKDKIDEILSLFPKTNRFVIKNDIRDYNGYLKYTSKKYYIENYVGAGIISFFRKNNKVLLNFHNLSENERTFILDICFEDILKNLEVIQIDQNIFDMKKDVLRSWNGNVVISKPNEI